MHELLHVDHIRFSYGSHPVLRDISFTLHRGEILCLFGPNGCGKTTMLECILGLLRPDAGQIRIDGKDIRSLSDKEIANQMAMVPQFQESTFGYTAHQMVLMGRTSGLGNFHSPTAEDDEIALAALEEVGMIAFKDRNYNSLSGGEAQMVKLARSIAQDTPLLVLDEPTAHLDFRNELKVIRQISRMAQQKNKAILMATHFPNQAYFLENEGNRTTIAIMDRGTIAAFGPARDVLHEENMAQIFGIQAKVYTHTEHGASRTYLMPIDFIQRKESAHDTI